MKILKLTISVLLLMLVFSFSTKQNAGFSVPSNDVDILGGAYLTFAEKFGGDLNSKDLKKYNNIGVSGCATGSKIFQFTLKISQQGKIKKFTGKSNQLSKEIIVTLSGLSKGDNFKFDNVKAKLPDKKSVVDVATKTFYVI